MLAPGRTAKFHLRLRGKPVEGFIVNVNGSYHAYVNRCPHAGTSLDLWPNEFLTDDGRPVRLTQALTDDDGRVRDLLERPLTPGDYRLEFGLGRGNFFERVSLDLHVTDVQRSYHVPLLLAPYSLTTYRGT